MHTLSDSSSAKAEFRHLSELRDQAGMLTHLTRMIFLWCRPPVWISENSQIEGFPPRRTAFTFFDRLRNPALGWSYYGTAQSPIVIDYYFPAAVARGFPSQRVIACCCFRRYFLKLLKPKILERPQFERIRRLRPQKSYMVC